MSFYTYINDPGILEEELDVLLEKVTDPRLHSLLTAIRSMIVDDVSPSVLAERCPYSVRVLQKKRKVFDETGCEGLLRQPGQGAHSRLSVAQQGEIWDLIHEDRPGEYEYAVWNGLTLREYIQKTYGVDYSVRAVQMLVRKLRSAPLRPELPPEKPKESDGEQ